MRIYSEVQVGVVNGCFVSFCVMTDFMFVACEISYWWFAEMLARKKNREIANLSLHQVCPAHYKLRIPELTVRPWAMILCNKVSTLSKIPSSWPGFFYFNKYIMVCSEMPFSKNSYRIETSQVIYFLARFCKMFSFYSNEHDVWFSNRRYRQLC